MFGRQSMRLLRETWKTPTQLAEELYAMFQDDIPLEHNAPLVLHVGDGPGLDLRRTPGSDGPMIRFGPRGSDEFNLGGFPDLNVDYDDDFNMVLTGPSIIFNVLDENGVPQQQVLGGPGDTIVNNTGAEGRTYPGQVAAEVGGGDYTVTTYPNGLAQPSATRTVTQVGLATGIPVGTWALVAEVTVTGSTKAYYMGVPVWLDDL